MYGMCNDGLCFSSEAYLRTIRFGKLFRREVRAEIPFYAVAKVEGEYLNIELCGNELALRLYLTIPNSR